jgi:hypothetical protein
VFYIKKTHRNNTLNKYTDTVKCINNQRGVINEWGWGQYWFTQISDYVKVSVMVPLCQAATVCTGRITIIITSERYIKLSQILKTKYDECWTTKRFNVAAYSFVRQTVMYATQNGSILKKYVHLWVWQYPECTVSRYHNTIWVHTVATILSRYTKQTAIVNHMLIFLFLSVYSPYLKFNFALVVLAPSYVKGVWNFQRKLRSVSSIRGDDCNILKHRNYCKIERS